MRHFVTFKKGTTLYGKVMPFTQMNRNEIQDRLVQEYSQMWDKIYTEPEASRVLSETLLCSDNFVPFGTECRDLNDKSVSVASITDWFKKAKPEPTIQNIIQQTAYHFEEVAEMCEALGNQKTADALIEYKEKLLSLTAAECELLWKRADKSALLDALCDQVVTVTGVAQYAGMNFDGALTEVNKSNWSKFDDNGNPIIDANGKILKGPNYFKPELKKFVGEK